MKNHGSKAAGELRVSVIRGAREGDSRWGQLGDVGTEALFLRFMSSAQAPQ